MYEIELSHQGFIWSSCLPEYLKGNCDPTNITISNITPDVGLRYQSGFFYCLESPFLCKSGAWHNLLFAAVWKNGNKFMFSWSTKLDGCLGNITVERMCWRNFAEGNHSTLASLQLLGSCLILYFFNQVSHHIDTFYILTARNSKTLRYTQQIWSSCNMDPNLQAENDNSPTSYKSCPPSSTTRDSMKRQLEDVSNKARVANERTKANAVCWTLVLQEKRLQAAIQTTRKWKLLWQRPRKPF